MPVAEKHVVAKAGELKAGQTARRAAVTADLSRLAEMIVWLSDEQGSTPVIVLPEHLSLRPPFFIQLAGELAGRLGNTAQRPIRFDWCQTPQRFFARSRARWARLQAKRLTAMLASQNDVAGERGVGPVTVEVTASIGRPGGQRRDLVIGVCEASLDLPAWTTAIRIQ